MSEPVRLGQILPAVLLDIAKRMEKVSPFVTRHLIPDARRSYSTIHNPKLKIQKLKAKALDTSRRFWYFLDARHRAASDEPRITRYAMIVGVMTAQLRMQAGPPPFCFAKSKQRGTRGITSLKQKRSIVKSVIGRLKARFNISIAEVDNQDNKNSAVVAMAMVSNDTRFIDQQFDAIINFMKKDGRFYLGKIERETFS